MAEGVRAVGSATARSVLSWDYGGSRSVPERGDTDGGCCRLWKQKSISSDRTLSAFENPLRINTLRYKELITAPSE